MPRNDGTAKCLGPCERTLPLNYLRRCIFCDNYICTSSECSEEQGSDFYSCVKCPKIKDLENLP